MVTLKYDGRLSNNIIQYLIAYRFAEKNNLLLNVSPSTIYGNFGSFFNFESPKGSIVGSETIIVDDSNFLDYLTKDEVDPKHYHFQGFFQNKTLFEIDKKNIYNIFNLKNEKIEEDKVFVHYRIGDIINDRRMLPYEYYDDCLKQIGLYQGYISSDSINHPFCEKLIKKYNLIPYQNTPLETINFGKNFKNIILSEGTFSWLIGFLNKGENVYCNERKYKWHGDINMNDWKKVSWDYSEESIYNNRFLKYYSPIKLY